MYRSEESGNMYLIEETDDFKEPEGIRQSPEKITLVVNQVFDVLEIRRFSVTFFSSENR